MAESKRFGLALVGLEDRLPKCAAVLNAQTPDEAALCASAGRDEVRAELERLNQDLAEACDDRAEP